MFLLPEMGHGVTPLTHSLTQWSRRLCALCSSPWRWPWHRPISLTRYRAFICQPRHATHPPAPPTDNVVTAASAHTSCTHTLCPVFFCAHRRDAQLLHRCWHQHSHPFAPWTTCFFRASGVHSPLTRVRESRDRICSETGSISAQLVVLGEHTLLCTPACVQKWGSVCALVLHQWLLGCVWWRHDGVGLLLQLNRTK
jgi:hypothetical protein